MNTSISDIETGMDVYGIGGEKIGSVAQVWPNAGNTRGIMGVTPGANEFGSGSLTTPEYQESRILEQVEGRGTRAGDIGTSTSSATSFGPDEPGHAPGKGPATVSSQEIGDEGYFVVDKGGILGIGVSHLYVPAKAVNDVAAGRVTLVVTKEQADRLYSQKPGFLQ